MGQINTDLQWGCEAIYGPPWTPGRVGRRVGIGTRWEEQAGWQAVVSMLAESNEILIRRSYGNCTFLGTWMALGLHLEKKPGDISTPLNVT